MPGEYYNIITGNTDSRLIFCGDVTRINQTAAAVVQCTALSRLRILLLPTICGRGGVDRFPFDLCRALRITIYT